MNRQTSLPGYCDIVPIYKGVPPKTKTIAFLSPKHSTTSPHKVRAAAESSVLWPFLGRFCERVLGGFSVGSPPKKREKTEKKTGKKHGKKPRKPRFWPSQNLQKKRFWKVLGDETRCFDVFLNVFFGMNTMI